MYILENNNKISSAIKCSFSDLGLKERKHLQEWMEKKALSYLPKEMLAVVEKTHQHNK